VKKEEPKAAPKPSSDDSLMKKKLERDAHNAALSGLIKLQSNVDSACSSAISASTNAVNQIKSKPNFYPPEGNKAYGYIHFNRAMRWQGYLDFDEIWYGGSLPQNKKPF